MAAILSCVLSIVFFVGTVYGHGYMIDPASRSSLWRVHDGAPQNYDDNQLYCGGMNVMWNSNGGKCGLCGDVYTAPHPQDNENTGKYGQGIIAGSYAEGSVITTSVVLTTNHKGHIQYSLCVLPDPNQPEPEDCFQNIPLADGSAVYSVSSEEKQIANQVQLPAGIKCDRCVLRWEYVAGNTWGDCGDGTQAQGCGPQETFKNCADIEIH